MPANRCYMIVIGAITDREAFLSGYATAVPPLVEKFGGRYRLKAAGGQFLENGWCDRPSALISEWPDRKAALRFWNSAEYAEVKKLRAGVGRFQVLLVDAPSIGN